MAKSTRMTESERSELCLWIEERAERLLQNGRARVAASLFEFAHGLRVQAHDEREAFASIARHEREPRIPGPSLDRVEQPRRALSGMLDDDERGALASDMQWPLEVHGFVVDDPTA